MEGTYSVQTKSVYGREDQNLTAVEQYRVKNYRTEFKKIEEGETFTPLLVITAAVHNDRVKEGDNTDYEVYIIISEETGYYTSSPSLLEDAKNMIDITMNTGEYLTGRVTAVRSKNNSGSYLKLQVL